MKRKSVLIAALALLLAVLLAGCGASEFGMNINTGKRMVIEAENADKDAFFTVGTLNVEEGEQITITSLLEKGSVKVEILAAPEGENADALPDPDGEVIITANLKPGENASGTVEAGSYLLRATCLEKATGTVQIEVVPAE